MRAFDCGRKPHLRLCPTSQRGRPQSAMQPYLNAFPLPNGPEVQSIPGAAMFNASYSNSPTLDAYSLRIDHKLSNKVSLFGRYDYSPSGLVQRGASAFALSTVSPTRITTQTATVGGAWGISPTISNDIRFNYSQTRVSGYYYLTDFGGAVPLSSSPFPAPYNSDDGNLLFYILPLTQGALEVGQNQRSRQEQINIVDSLSLQKNSHGLKFGVDFRRLSPRYGPSAYIQEAVFGDVPSVEAGTLLESVLQSSLSPTFLFRNLGIYAQDTWRIIPRLNVTYGLRWDVDFVPQTLGEPGFSAVTGFNLDNLSDLELWRQWGRPPTRPLMATLRSGLDWHIRSLRVKIGERCFAKGLVYFTTLRPRRQETQLALASIRSEPPLTTSVALFL